MPVKPPDFLNVERPERRLIFVKNDAAVNDLISRNIVTRDQFDALNNEAKQRAFTVAGEASTDVIDRIRTALVEDIEEGASLRTFREKLDETIGASRLSPAHQETVFRTGVQSAFAKGQNALMRNSLMQAIFPYRRYIAIKDSRVRPEHLSLTMLGIQGTNIYRSADPFWGVWTPPLSYNCRCGSRAITVNEASRYGIREARSWLQTGTEPQLESRLPFIPFDPDPDFIGPGTTALSLRPHHQCWSNDPIEPHELNRQLRALLSGDLYDLAH